MFMRNLVPSLRHKGGGPRRSDEERAINHMQREMNYLFESFFNRFRELSSAALGRDLFAPSPLEGEGHSRTFSPALDIKDTDKEFIIRADLPGIDEKDINVSFAGNAITIEGEKKADEEEKGEGYYQVERSYGYFSRSIPLPAGLDTEKVEGQFKKGVLTIRIPRSSEVKKGKRIAIKAE